MGANSWVKTYAINDRLSIESLYLCVCIQLIEVAYSECQIGIGEELDSLCFLHAHEDGINVFLDGTFLEKSGEGSSLGRSWLVLQSLRSLHPYRLTCRQGLPRDSMAFLPNTFRCNRPGLEKSYY